MQPPNPNQNGNPVAPAGGAEFRYNDGTCAEVFDQPGQRVGIGDDFVPDIEVSDPTTRVVFDVQVSGRQVSAYYERGVLFTLPGPNQRALHAAPDDLSGLGHIVVGDPGTPLPIPGAGGVREYGTVTRVSVDRGHGQVRSPQRTQTRPKSNPFDTIKATFPGIAVEIDKQEQARLTLLQQRQRAVGRRAMRGTVPTSPHDLAYDRSYRGSGFRTR